MIPLIVFLALFLLLLAALSLATVKLFAAKDPAGNVTAPGWAGGCATGCALMFVALLGIAAFIAGVAAISAANTAERVVKRLPELVKELPEVKVGAWLDREKFVHPDGEHSLHLIVQWKGHSEPTDKFVEAIQNIDRDKLGGDMEINVLDYGADEQGEPITVVEVKIAMDEDDAEELQEQLKDKLGDLSLDDGVEITLKSVDKR